MVDPIFGQLHSINGADNQTSKPAIKPENITGPNFADTLANVEQVHFSNHVQKRIQTRNIVMTEDNVSRLSEAIDKAEKRGGKSSLVLMDDLAFVVNVPNRTVVTAMPVNNRGEGVFTQIDSVVLADPAHSAGHKKLDIKG